MLEDGSHAPPCWSAARVAGTKLKDGEKKGKAPSPMRCGLGFRVQRVEGLGSRV